jgi:hypothetical protein
MGLYSQAASLMYYLIVVKCLRRAARSGVLCA